MHRFLLFALLAIGPAGAQLLVDTYAGGVIRSGVPANSVALGYLSGVAWDPSGNIVFCDQKNDVIRRVGSDGTIATIAGTGATGFAGDAGPATSALINSPSIPKYDASGNLYFLDTLNYRIRRVDAKGIITSVAGDGQSVPSALNAPGPATSRPIAVSDFAVDALGTLYIAGNGVIARVTPGGNMNVFATVVDPQGVAIDPSGNLYVFSAAGYGSLLRISGIGAISTFYTFPTNVAVPDSVTSLSTDAAGNLYAKVNLQLLRFAPDGTSTVVSTPGSIAPPLAIDAQGNIAFATLSQPYQVKVLYAQSVLTTVAGANPQPAPDATPLRSAWFLAPSSIAFSRAGDLYIAESGACQIRKISAAGVLSTFAGHGACDSPATANSIYPQAIALDSKSNVWVVDYVQGMYFIAPDGTRSTVIKTPIAGEGPQLAVDSQDRIYLLGSLSLYRVLSDMSAQAIVAAPPQVAGFCNCPSLSGLGADSSGNIYFSAIIMPATTAYSDNTYVVNGDGTYSLKYPNFYPSSIAFDPSGNIWGTGASLLTTFNATGVSYLGLTPGYAGDGGLAQSSLMTAASLVTGPDGNLYFIDNNTRIRRITGSEPVAAPVISQNGIVDAINYATGPIAPGEIISIFGSNFGVGSLQVNAPVNNAIPRVLGRTKVFVNNEYGAITAATPTQINVLVPFEATTTPVSVQVQVDGILSASVSLPLVPSAPGFSPSILNQDGTVNNAANPAQRGSIVSLYGTGLGSMTPQLPNGSLAVSTPFSTAVNPISLTIGGQPAQILYAGDAPTFPTGVFQINAVIPTTVSPGPAFVSGQVTVFVK